MHFLPANGSLCRGSLPPPFAERGVLPLQEIVFICLHLRTKLLSQQGGETEAGRDVTQQDGGRDRD